MQRSSNLQTFAISILCLAWLMLGNVQNIVLWDNNIRLSTIVIIPILIIFIPLFSCILNCFVPITDMREALINVLVSLSFYYVIKMLEYNSVFVIISVVVFSVLSIFVFEIRRRYVKRKLFSIVYFMRYIWCGIFIMILLPAHIYYRYDKPVESYFAEGSRIVENTDKVNIYAIKNLNEEKWQKMSNNERMDMLCDVIKLQADELGIDSPAVAAINMEMDLVAAYYVHSEKKIYFNSICIDRNLKDAVTTALHELYHVYQNEVIDSLENADLNSIKKLSYYSKAIEWKEAAESYADDKKTYHGYSENPLESDARLFSESEVEKYKFE